MPTPTARRCDAGWSDRISRQLMLSFMIELMPEPSNRITVDGRYIDALGNLRPVISYSLPEYTMDAVAASRRVSRRLFQRLGAEDQTRYDPLDTGFVAHQGEGYVIRGGNHWAGTHIMGSTEPTTRSSTTTSAPGTTRTSTSRGPGACRASGRPTPPSRWRRSRSAPRTTSCPSRPPAQSITVGG